MDDSAPSRGQAEMSADTFAVIAGRVVTPGELLGRCYHTYDNARHSPLNEELPADVERPATEGQGREDRGMQCRETEECHEQ